MYMHELHYVVYITGTIIDMSNMLPAVQITAGLAFSLDNNALMMLFSTGP